jgi:hypothetical protein
VSPGFCIHLLVPLLHFLLLLGILAVLILTNMLSTFLLTCGTISYWLVICTAYPVLLLILYAMRRHMLWKYHWKNILDLHLPMDLHWNPRNTLVYPLIATSVGLLAGMLGIGGAAMIAPLLLELGVRPTASAASTQFLQMLNGCTATVVYAVNKSIPWDYALVLIVIAVIATVLGQLVITYIVKKLGRSSPIVICLAFVLGLAASGAMAVFVIKLIELVQHPIKLGATRGVCNT